VADQTPLKSGVGIPEINQKFEPRTWHKINLRSGAKSKKIFTLLERTFLKSQLINGLSENFEIFWRFIFKAKG
jgi:hypothetical protein